MEKHVICPSWLSFGLVNRIRCIFHNPLEMFRDYIGPGSVAADIGCGPGYFSIPMAYMVGPKGKVISVDIQSKMIEKVRKRIERLHLEERFSTIVCQSDDIGIKEKVDFVLTFWMVHEVKYKSLFFRQIRDILKDDGNYLLVEPKIHVSGKEYSETIKLAEQSGLKVIKEVKISMSRASLLGK
jgi:ubiquinone/menaquinone biosynthesis C-methylase UbiE